MPLAALPLDLEGRLFGILLGLGVGTVVTWTVARWRIHSARGSVLKGDARDTVVIEHHIVERRAGPTGQPVPARLRTRYLGQAAVSGVIPNAHLAAELHKRADAVGEQAAMISMEGATGSYLLETLCGFVCDRVANAPFPHGLYVMAPIREPAKLAYHKPISVMLVALDDLPLFSRWEDVAGIETERGTDGVRVLTLLDLARRWQEEQRSIAAARAEGRSVRHMETMFVLDLALDTSVADIPTRPIPWHRFASALRSRNLALALDARTAPFRGSDT